MPAVARKDQLKGIGEIASGVISLAIATDRGLAKRDRRISAGFGASGIAIGAGRATGQLPVQAVGGSALATTLTAGVASIARGRIAGRKELTTTSRRKERLDGLRELTAAAVALAIAADATTAGHLRRLNAGVGAAGLVTALGKVRGGKKLQALGAVGGVAAVAFSAAAAARRGAPRKV